MRERGRERGVAIRYEINVKRAKTIEKFNFFNHGIRIKQKRQNQKLRTISTKPTEKLKLYIFLEPYFNRFGARVWRNVQ